MSKEALNLLWVATHPDKLAKKQEPSDLDVWRARALQAEAVIEKFMAEQPAQRTWVGLSDAQNTVIWANSQSVDEAIRATEKQLMENNK